MVSFPAKRSQTSFPTANGSTALLRLPIGVAPGLAQTPYVPTDGPAGALYSSAKRSAVRPPKDAAALRLGSGCGGGGICRGTTRRASTSAGRAATRGSARLPRCGSRTAARGAAAQGAGLTGAGRGLAPGGGLAAGGGLAGAAASRGIGTAGAGAAAGAGTTGGATGGAAGGAAAGAGATRGAAGGGPAGGAEVAAASSSEGCCSPDSEPTPPSCAARGGAASSAGSSPASVATSACAASPACAASSASPISASASSGGGSSADASTSAISLSAGAAPSSAASSASASSPIALATLCSRSRDGDGEQTSSAQRTEPGVLAPLRPLRTAGDSIGGGGCSSSGAGGGGASTGAGDSSMSDGAEIVERLMRAERRRPSERRNSFTWVDFFFCTRGTPRSPADSRTRFGAGRALKVPKERISSSSRSACDLGSGARPTRASERNWMATGTVGLGGACGGGGACGFSRGPSERKRRGVRRKEATCSASRRAAPGEEWREPALLLDRLLAGDGPGGEAGAERDEAKWNSRGTVSWAVERAGGFAPESDSTAASCRLHFSERALISFISRRAARSSSSSDVAGSSPHTSTAPA
mmetsp:Transcript_37527/g.121529  ORF Transcript_37527/g.121529 Transcript_37527/m.121529 type:complete len:586 (-) Transcript_37527:953-2710(-)